LNPKAPNTAPAPTPVKDAPMGDTARHAACRALARQSRVFPDMDLTALDHALTTETAPMTDLDRAFAHAIYDAAIRNWLSLSFLLSRCTTQPYADLEPRLRGVLLAAAAQIILLDRVPVHAATNHAVEWAKRVIRPGAGGLVNAVIRKLIPMRPEEHARSREKYTGLRDEIPTSDGGAVAISQPVLPEDELERLCVATSHPRAVLEHWLLHHPIRDVRNLALHGCAQPPTILNTAHATTPIRSDDLVPHNAPGHHVFVGHTHALVNMLKSRPDIWVQDPASSLVVESVADLKPSLIMDLCAGQGTKTRQLMATFPNAEIIATDVDGERYRVLQETFKGSQQVNVIGNRQIQQRFLGKADLILLDVPCSNTGVLARRPEARYRFGPESLKSLLGVQKQIIADCILLRRENPRGRILYSTCSLEPEENQQHAAWTNKWHKTGVSREHQQMPRGLPGEPGVGYCDGSYAALLG
jgi:16S rRNA (cytosine967-C5)-methyltransferase